MPARDRALCTEIVYGVLRRQRTLDRTLRPFCRRPLAKLDAPVRVALRIALYQCAYLDSVPPHAAVHRTVEALKRQRPRATGLANAVLRAWLRAGGEIDAGSDSSADHYDLPDWLAVRWESRSAAKWLAATLAPPVAFLRASSEEGLAQTIGRLTEDGGEAVPGLRVARSVRLGSLDRRTLSEVIADGLAVPRSEAAQMVTELMGQGPGTILDACSGRGGKGRQLAEEGSRVLCLDSHSERLSDARTLARRTGATGLDWVRCDLGRDLPVSTRFSRILVDVPCSGLGTIRRHPEIKWRTSEEGLAALADTQRAILSNTLQVLDATGELLYVTCSTEPEENEEVVESALSADPTIARKPFEVAPDGCSVDVVGDLRTFPLDPDLDGFYVARLTRLAAQAPC